VIRSIFVPQERLAEAAFAQYIIPVLLRDIIPIRGYRTYRGHQYPKRSGVAFVLKEQFQINSHYLRLVDLIMKRLSKEKTIP